MSDTTTRDLKQPVSVSLAPELIAWLDSLADEMGITRSALITVLINRARKEDTI